MQTKYLVSFDRNSGAYRTQVCAKLAWMAFDTVNFGGMIASWFDKAR